MPEGSYDANAIAEACYKSPAIGSRVTTVSVGTNATVLLAFNTGRAFVVLQNTGSNLYVKLGTGATLANYSFKLSPNAIVSIDHWGGAVTAVRNSTASDVIVTEAY